MARAPISRKLKGYFTAHAAAASRRPWWELTGLAVIIALTAFAYIWALSRNGMGNSYYAAAVKSGSISWKAFLFGSLDPGNFITVDKTPAAFWAPALFARAFGFSSWSILLPQALAGVASMLILYRLVRRWQGELAALVAALLFALTPVVLLMFRYNNPDAFLTLLLLLAAWAFWSALETGSGWRLAGSGALIGFAFLTKMLEAFVILPVLVLVYLACAKPRFLRRLIHLFGALVALVAASGWWVALVELWPASSRPYIGGSGDNSVLGLALSRTAGYGDEGAMGGGGPGGGGVGGAPGFGGESGWLRMFNDQLGGEISWLLPLALLGFLAGLWITRAGRRTDLKRAGFLLWGLWTLIFVLVFSFADGVLHPYYAIVMGPGVAALVGGGSIALWRLGRSNRWLCWLLPAGVLGSALWSAALLERTPDFAPGLDTAVLVLGALGAAALLVASLSSDLSRYLVGATEGVAALITGVALLAGPVAYDLATISRSVTGGLAASGPVSAASAARPDLLASGNPAMLPGPASQSQAGGGVPTGDAPAGGAADGAGQAAALSGLIAYLEAHQGTAEYLVAVRGANTAAPLILATGKPVMAMGGFSGGDPAPTLDQFKELVATGRVRYLLVNGDAGPLQMRDAPGRAATAPVGPLPRGYAPPPGVFPGPLPRELPQDQPGRGTDLQAIFQYATEVGTLVPPREYGGRTGSGLGDGLGAGALYYLGD
jgi:4-amino-4-deoxy-L-arabinose transferase-like glycosyltransferase